MTDINSLTVVGRVVRDIDEKAYMVTKNGTARLNLSIAVNRSVKQGDQWQDEASFFDVTVWGKSAENLRKYITKGTQIAVDGYLKQDRWEKDGHKQSKVYIVADNVQLLGGKRDGQAPSGQPSAPQGGFDPSAGFPEDIPF